MVKSIPGRRGGIHSRWARGGAILILVATLGWLLLTAGQVQDRKQSCILGANIRFFQEFLSKSTFNGNWFLGVGQRVVVAMQRVWFGILDLRFY